MSKSEYSQRQFFEDLPNVKIEDVRRTLGGKRKLSAANSVTLFLADGRELEVKLVKKPGVLGGTYSLLMCPTCQRASKILRVIEEDPGLACVKCPQTIYGMKYRSQVIKRRMLSADQGHEDASVVS
ncbi:MAG TPA: hypothetical protein PLC99_13280 [Verrucomicrobiota bacterium]|nr:hypothetical protein [Verrucomicrobiota bacterium]